MNPALHYLSTFLPRRPRAWASAAYHRLPLGHRDDRGYREVRAMLEGHRHASREELVAFRDQQLARLIEHAYQHVPYYRNIMQDRALRPSDIQTVADLTKLPLLTKDTVMSSADQLLARNIPSYLGQPVNTGGSTGRTLNFYIQRGYSFAREQAFMHEQWSRFGFVPGDRIARIRGDAPHTPGGLARYDRATKALAISTFHLTPDRIPELAAVLEEFQPKFLHAYPSTIAHVTRMLQERGIQPRIRVQAILCGSENVHPPQRRALEEFWKCRVASWYGHAELCLLGGGCEHSDMYHFFPQYGALEMIPAQFSGAPPGLCELVGTSFNNPVMPFIRYATQDFGYASDAPCPCGRAYDMVARIEGRLHEYVVTRTGQVLAVTALIWGQHYECFGRVDKFQLEQYEPGKVLMRVVPRPSFTKDDEVELRERMSRATGGGLTVELAYVDDIPATAAGKYKFMIQHLAIGLGD